MVGKESSALLELEMVEIKELLGLGGASLKDLICDTLVKHISHILDCGLLVFLG